MYHQCCYNGSTWCPLMFDGCATYAIVMEINYLVICCIYVLTFLFLKRLTSGVVSLDAPNVSHEELVIPITLFLRTFHVMARSIEETSDTLHCEKIYWPDLISHHFVTMLLCRQCWLYDGFEIFGTFDYKLERRPCNVCNINWRYVKPK